MQFRQKPLDLRIRHPTTENLHQRRPRIRLKPIHPNNRQNQDVTHQQPPKVFSQTIFQAPRMIGQKV
jgi:hypothetical protein